jgi:hypothetical protein
MWLAWLGLWCYLARFAGGQFGWGGRLRIVCDLKCVYGTDLHQILCDGESPSNRHCRFSGRIVLSDDSED